MKRLILKGIVGLGCLLPLMGCVVPVEPARPVAFAPPFVAPEPLVVVGRPGYYRRGYYRRPVYVGRRGHVRRGYARRGYYYR